MFFRFKLEKPKSAAFMQLVIAQYIKLDEETLARC
jgi:hypothetical protein